MEATDGRWYPPEQHPHYQPPQRPSVEPAQEEPPRVAASHRALEAKGFFSSVYDFSFSSLITLPTLLWPSLRCRSAMSSI